MTTLCITGTPGRDFESVCNVLFNNGLAPAKPIERETTISIEDWHGHVAPLLRRQQEPGRLWEQLAGDLLLANFQQPQWGWSSPASLDALEFWCELEPGMGFLLLSSDPQEYLAYNLLEGTTEKGVGVDEKTCLEQWRNQHERMLTFYLDNPERCLLVNARQARANPSALAEKLKERWGVELDLSSSYFPVLAGNSQQEAPITLAHYVAEKTLVDHGKGLAPLRAELQAAQLPLAEPDVEADLEGNILGSANLSLTSILRDYQQRCARDLSDSERKALETLRRENEQLLAKLRYVQEQLEATTEKQQGLEQQLEEFKALPTVSPEELADLEEQRLVESEMLLLQLHQVQEELEASLLKQQESAEALAESAETAQRASAESKQLREDRQQVEHQLQESTGHNEELLLQLNQVQEELEHYCLKFQEVSQEANKLKDENRKLSVQKELAQKQIETPSGWLSRLGTRKPEPKVSKLAYKKIQLKRELINPDYEHLWITLRDATFRGQYASNWHFRLSCAGIKPKEFGKQPKLEIPEQPNQLLQNWFEESENEHGKKLELRFALPNAMDSAVWKQITNDDQEFIKSLIEQLPELLNELKETGCHISRDWAEWQKLAADMKHIHKKKTRK
ncbi:hypothetical protein [Saccharospirillum sp.]|uniref:hypothetical protein n=1 Tax=Saccharospirillum sp. TaxID=2033801 RepID=UPI0034A09E25